MTYKERVEGVLDGYKNYVVESMTLQATDVSNKKINKHQATQQIINLKESVIPKKLPDSSICNCCDECGNSVPWEAGYNQAIKDIKNKLIGGTK